MAIYIVFDTEIDKLAKGEIKPEDLKKPEKEALLTFTGEDVKELLKQMKEKVKLEDIIYKVQKGLESCDCWLCIKCAIQNALE